jgi:FdhD protein
MTDSDSRHSDHAIETVAVARADGSRDVERVAVERALEVRVNGEPLAVIMRTPGADEDLAAGFLLSEGALRRPGDLQRIDRAAADVVNVVTARGRADAVAALLGRRRPVAVNASCGACGRPEIASLGHGLVAIAETWTVASDVMRGLPARLSEAQPVFAETGGLHAAGLFDADGHLAAVAEDVGRHNAVDKLIGQALRAGALPLATRLLLVSGRVSFEILQKAWAGGIPIVAAVSAPSSLAIELAARANITLIGFLRDQRFNVYTCPARIEGWSG